MLEKLAALSFSLDELVFLFTADDERCGDIFPMQDECDALEQPLDLPAGEHEFSLRHLRRKLLCAAACVGSRRSPASAFQLAVDGGAPANGTAPRVMSDAKSSTSPRPISTECADEWDWRRVEKVLQEELGFALNRHSRLGAAFLSATTPEGWLSGGPAVHALCEQPSDRTDHCRLCGAPEDGPFQYDAGLPDSLWTHIPLA